MATIRQTRSWFRRSASVLAGGAVALSVLGLAAGIAQSAPAPSYHWCPADQWDLSWGSIYDWDWNHCHDWQRAAGLGGPIGNGPWGVPPSWAPPSPPPPPWAPGASVMWNQTAAGWGFWNNGIWTSA